MESQKLKTHSKSTVKELTNSKRRFAGIPEEKNEQTQSSAAEFLVIPSQRFLELLLFNRPVLIPIHHLETPDYIRVSARRKRYVHVLRRRLLMVGVRPVPLRRRGRVTRTERATTAAAAVGVCNWGIRWGRVGWRLRGLVRVGDTGRIRAGWGRSRWGIWWGRGWWGVLLAASGVRSHCCSSLEALSIFLIVTWRMG